MTLSTRFDRLDAAFAAGLAAMLLATTSPIWVTLAEQHFAPTPAVAADTARCGTDSECAALPECKADPNCDGGPETDDGRTYHPLGRGAGWDDETDGTDLETSDRRAS